MSKITFRADDDLVEQLETLDISKSEAMREALRSYLAADGSTRVDSGAERTASTGPTQTGAIDDLVRNRVDELLTDRLRELGLESAAGQQGGVRAREQYPADGVTVSVSLEGDHHRGANRQSTVEHDDEHESSTDDGIDDSQLGTDETPVQCNQCGEDVADDHVYCPNCGEKTSRRLFCECGDEIRSDWSFCPGCGRRTPAADVLGRENPT